MLKNTAFQESDCTLRIFELGDNIFDSSICISSWSRPYQANNITLLFNSLDSCILTFGKHCGSSFAAFVKCLILLMEEEKTEFFGHVQTTYSRCGICDYPYNYVGESWTTDMSGVSQNAISSWNSQGSLVYLSHVKISPERKLFKGNLRFRRVVKCLKQVSPAYCYCIFNQKSYRKK